ncbi:MAG: hypothetical protein DDT23_00033 [candidate division WS2 bacterium]|nr:hypothetical protein [Candidatus Lithacetigena glycinireducens]
MIKIYKFSNITFSKFQSAINKLQIPEGYGIGTDNQKNCYLSLEEGKEQYIEELQKLIEREGIFIYFR